MSNEEFERMMNFIIERQEYAAAQLAQLIEMQADHDERIARFERSYVTIAQLLEKHDKQLDSVTEGLNNATTEIAKLATLVNRYIAARGNGSNGGA
jgi:ABC-type transporter Mla subunit MlaD